ncbi:hypothetical protein SAMD00019534_094560 [Acytostelium subglobosum LB1]|uniref:hypothetical protein n=1 Tax=Acytostelium subglobosum LB1 TaxID=1410327 RepID=UPI000644DBDC|nr:hypothetical protein SAMD00019534_094560 [Acytostelium subglobosum LB1]GAM26281.1 hypothetical protein SAMD00019534_094560 [Acytostelium subglobosum LB1]|eukprot:XP_012750835.1 hypothetical protein SAMD00019534_094560 [Acytostelium subglobosum LB1]
MFNTKYFLFFFAALLVIASAQDHRCSNTPGYQSWFQMTSFNAMFPSGSGSNVALSFFEEGNSTIDFHGQRERSDYRIVMTEGVVEGSIWLFGKTSEMYVLQAGQCTKMPLNFPVPDGFPIGPNNYIGNTRLGQFFVEAYFLTDQSPSTALNQTIYYDEKSCSVVSSFAVNADPATPGNSIMNFFNFEDRFHESSFDLPAACTQTRAVLHRRHQQIVLPNHIHMLFGARF